MLANLFILSFRNQWFEKHELQEIEDGFSYLNSCLNELKWPNPLEIAAPFSAFFLYAHSVKFGTETVKNYIDFFVNKNFESPISEELFLLLDQLYSHFQWKRNSGLIEKINERKSLTHSNEVEDFRSSLDDPRLTGLYSNLNEKLNIDFTVDILPFPLQILDPRIVRIPAGKNNELHKHAHETVFIFLSGTGIVKVDSNEIPVKSGDFVFIPRWCMHQSMNTSNSEMIFLAVADFGITGKSFTGNYLKTARLKEV
jgi:mannose-6-phosphate isomerase-like protein (cupin superfamily)